MFPEQTESKRLSFRKIEFNDADFIFGYATDPEVVKYVAWQAPVSIEDTKRYIQEALQGWQNCQWFEYLIIRKSNSEPIGAVSLILEGHAATIGYVITQKYWGNGYATEAALHILHIALARPEIYRVWTVTDVDHPASCRVLEKSGMTREGRLRKWKIRPNLDNKNPRDSYCYSVIKES